MKVGLDTSFVLRLLTGEPVNMAQTALEHLNQIQKSGHKAIVSDLVVTEVYFALQHHYKVPKVEALKFLKEFFVSDQIENQGTAVQVLALPHLESAKPGFVDRMIYQQYIREAAGMITFEKASRKLPKVFVLEA